MNASNTAVVTMLFLAMRERARDMSNVTAARAKLIRMGEQIVDNDYFKFWKDLEEAGIGTFIAGRRGSPDRFKWHYSLRAIAKAAIEGAELSKLPSAPGLPELVRPKAVTDSRNARIFITLANGETAEIILPNSASIAEISRVRNALEK